MAEPDNKKKKPNYFMQKKKLQYSLTPGLKGFLCSCNFREKDCIRESYNILNQYSEPDPTAKPEPLKPKDSDEEDIADELSKEIDSFKTTKPTQRKFQVVESGAKNFLFIRTTIEDPVKLVGTILEDILATKEQKTKFLLRLVPIEITCKANLNDIKFATEQLADKYFSADPKSFAVAFNHRNNNQLNRDDVIKEIANVIVSKNPKHTVNLKNAELTVIVEIIRGICLMSVLPDYNKYKKYNLQQVAESVVQPTEGQDVLEEQNVAEDKTGTV